VLLQWVSSFSLVERFYKLEELEQNVSLRPILKEKEKWYQIMFSSCCFHFCRKIHWKRYFCVILFQLIHHSANMDVISANFMKV